MIVRCKNCVSAFAVNDEKVIDKKFAFTCPKCGTENIIDNRKKEKQPQPEEAFIDDFPAAEIPAEKEPQKKKIPDHDKIIPEHEEIPAGKPPVSDEIFDDDQFSETEKKSKKLNLDIEETEEFPDFDDSDLFADETAPVKKRKEEDIPTDQKKPAPDDELISFEEPVKQKAKSDEFDIELKDESDDLLTGEDDILLDDFNEPAPVKAKEKKAEEVSEFPEFEEPPSDVKSEREKKLTSQDDIDALFAAEGIKYDERPISKESELDLEDEITVDLDTLDIDLEEPAPAAAPKPKKAEAAKPSEEEDITLDIDSLDIDLEEPAPAAAPKPKKAEAAKPSEEEDITLDIDSLDIDLEEPAPAAAPKPKKAEAAKPSEEEDITLDIDSLDIDLEEPAPAAAPKPKKAEAAKPSEEEDITLDIDSLDIDLEEPKPEPVITAPGKSKEKTAGTIAETEIDSEEELKLNLDELDIDIEEIEKRELIFEDDIEEKPPAAPKVKSKPLFEEDEEEDESITIDLKTLELDLAEESTIMKGEISDEDEKPTLDDAGLTFDELTPKVKKAHYEEPVDEELKLTLDEIDPALTLEKISQAAPREAEKVSDKLDELPEIDLDEYDAIIREEEAVASKKPVEKSRDDIVIFPALESGRHGIQVPENDILEYEEPRGEEQAEEIPNTVFSIDLSLKYSRTGAILRLFGLYILSMIPHFIVMLVYTILSSILGFINQLVILSSGRCVEDFSLIIENTTRYFLYIKTNIIGIVEDRPVYTGKEKLDHPLQLNITFPLRYSKNIALLRLSIIGIMLISIPHLFVIFITTIPVPFIYLAGIISVIISRRWPNVLFIYLTKYFGYMARLSSFMLGLTDEYPPFRFD
jgi:hypothetical protein